jgi:transposase
MILTDELWSKIQDIIPSAQKASNGAGRPAYPRRQVLDGILWVLISGARWKDLPSEYPGYKTCHRLFQDWQRQGVFEEIFHILSLERYEKCGEDTKIGYVDGTFVPAKKGARTSAEVIRERAAQSWPSAMGLVGLLDSVFTAQITMKPNA